MNFASAFDFTFSRKSLFCEIQYGRCVRGFWRHILSSPLLALCKTSQIKSVTVCEMSKFVCSIPLQAIFQNTDSEQLFIYYFAPYYIIWEQNLSLNKNVFLPDVGELCSRCSLPFLNVKHFSPNGSKFAVKCD